MNLVARYQIKLDINNIKIQLFYFFVKFLIIDSFKLLIVKIRCMIHLCVSTNAIIGLF